MRYKPEDGFPYYVDLTKGEDLRTLFSKRFVLTRLESLSEAKAAYCYAPGKWSIKQVLGHITDHERIKMARAFFLSRNESVELWGYDQDSLVENSRFDELTLKQLAADLENVRSASISFIDTLSERQLNIKGRARQYEITLEDFLKSVIGHEIHHLNILEERYI